MASSDPDSRLLLLMRHGKADSSSESSDRERELTDRGVAQAALIGEYLESQGVRPTRVLVSDSVRTRGTWQALLQAMPGFDGKATFHEQLYSGTPADALDLIRTRKDKHAVVLVIGHEPTMGILATALADEDSDPGSLAQARIGLSTGQLAVLSAAEEHWGDLHEQGMRLHTIVRP